MRFVRLSMEDLHRKEAQEALLSDAKLPLMLILDNIRSMNNVGSIFRNADAFHLQKIFLCGITPCPPHRDIEKTALGATSSVAWEYVQDAMPLIQQLQADHVRVCAVEQVEGSTLLTQMQWQNNKITALVFGNELRGVDDRILACVDECIEIPQLGMKHSINVAVSTGIVSWDFFKHYQMQH